jgi:NAD(P)-dependent dehydrogenase (short-subunit alcohol dehydrogenase family)
MTQLSNRVAAITGAASGIGRALAVNLAKRGCSVALADVDRGGLAETAKGLENEPVEVTTHVVDVAERDQVYRFAEDVASRHGKVNIIINNAGVGISESLEDVTYEDLEWIFGINLWGVIHGCKAFLPHLKAQDEGHIVNISSVHGLFTNPHVGPYCTTKFAVRGFTLALCQELKETHVAVSCVHPGGIKTNIARNARFRKSFDPQMSREESVRNFDQRIARTSADKAARVILSGIEKNKKRIRVGPDAYLLDWWSRLAPVTWQKLMGGDWPILTALLLSPLLLSGAAPFAPGRKES